MTDDLLKEAARALRRETECDEDSGKFTRARVMASLHQSRVKRRTRLAFVLPLAASFAAATAWGTVSGKAPEIARSVVEALGFSVEPAPAPAPSSRRPLRSKAPAPAPAPTQSVPTTAPEPEPVEGPLEFPPAPAPPARRTVSPSGEIGQGGRADRDPAHDLYRVAHRAHFVDQDCSRAVDAWSAYLRAAPAGRFAPEARYNRAICLVRLGRRDAARAALAAFAKGQYGTYRQKDAQALIDALDR